MQDHRYRPICAQGAFALIEAIVWQASLDWREASKILARTEREDALALKEDAERFFLSEWFHALTGMDGKKIVSELYESFTTGSDSRDPFINTILGGV